MLSTPHLWLSALFLVALTIQGHAQPPSAPAASDSRQIDLSKPFATRSPWRLVVTQGTPEEDPSGNPDPGALSLCLQKAPNGPCLAGPISFAGIADLDRSNAWGPHYLKLASPVYPQGRSGPPLLQLVTASMHGGNGDQVVVTQLLAYSRVDDAFVRVYLRRTGSNNNQEVRFIGSGPLRGDVISAEPTQDAPFAYWIVVNQFTRGQAYRQVLRYRSATRYGDGNPLSVIDAEMPNIQRRLGVWNPGMPLPVPANSAQPCMKPHLKDGALWCD